jgi:putative Mn2+ efflux pump MntP
VRLLNALTLVLQKNIKNIQSEWVSAAVLSLLGLYYILFYEHFKDTNESLTRKAALLTSCKNIRHLLCLYYIMNKHLISLSLTAVRKVQQA